METNLLVGPEMDAKVVEILRRTQTDTPSLPYSTDNAAAFKILDTFAPLFTMNRVFDGKKYVVQFEIIWDIAQYQTYAGKGETIAEAICRAILASQS